MATAKEHYEAYKNLLELIDSVYASNNKIIQLILEKENEMSEKTIDTFYDISKNNQRAIEEMRIVLDNKMKLYDISEN